MEPAMTRNLSPAAIGQFGQVLAFAERTLSASLRRQLAERETAPETWYALKLVGAGRPTVSRQSLTSDLEGSRTLNPQTVRELLVDLQARGLIRGDADVELTAEGDALYRSLAAHLAGPTSELLGQFDPDDIETTIRTLRAITVAAGG
jgi:DNA-binding MarR family transcriptional regulator